MGRIMIKFEVHDERRSPGFNAFNSTNIYYITRRTSPQISMESPKSHCVTNDRLYDEFGFETGFYHLLLLLWPILFWPTFLSTSVSSNQTSASHHQWNLLSISHNYYALELTHHTMSFQKYPNLFPIESYVTISFLGVDANMNT